MVIGYPKGKGQTQNSSEFYIHKKGQKYHTRGVYDISQAMKYATNKAQPKFKEPITRPKLCFGGRTWDSALLSSQNQLHSHLQTALSLYHHHFLSLSPTHPPSNVLRHLQLEVAEIVNLSLPVAEVSGAVQASGAAGHTFLYGVVSTPVKTLYPAGLRLSLSLHLKPAFTARCFQGQGECHRHRQVSPPQV